MMDEDVVYDDDEDDKDDDDDGGDMMMRTVRVPTIFSSLQYKQILEPI